MNNENYMLIIPTKWLLEDNAEAPEGTTIIQCKECGRKFAIPNDQNNNEPDATCEDCINAKSIDNMKNNNSEASNVINTALGN